MRMIGDIALKLSALQSMDVHHSSSEFAVSMSILTSLRAGDGAAPEAPRAANFTLSIGISNEFSFHWLFSPERNPIGWPLKLMRSRSGWYGGDRTAPESTSYAGWMSVAVGESRPAATSAA